MSEVFDLREFIIYCFKKLKVLLIVGIVLGIAFAGAGYYKTLEELKRPVTTATCSVNTKSNLQSSKDLIDTMASIKSIITSDFFYISLAEYLDEKVQIKLTLSEIKANIIISTKGTAILTEVSGTNLAKTGVVASKTADFLAEYLPNFFQNYVIHTESIQPATNLKPDTGTLIKNSILYGGVGFVGGLIIVIMISFFVKVMDLHIETPDEFKKYGTVLSNVNNLNIITASILSNNGNTMLATTSCGIDITEDIDKIATNLGANVKLVVLRIQDDYVTETDKSLQYDNKENYTSLTVGNANITAYKELLNTILTDTEFVLAYSNDYTSLSTTRLAALLDNAILIEQLKISRSDYLSTAIDALNNMKLKVLGIIIK